MNRIDETKEFVPVRIAVLTVSDTRKIEDDKSGDTLCARLLKDGHLLADRDIVIVVDVVFHCTLESNSENDASH